MSAEVKDLLGTTLVSVTVDKNNDEITLTTSEGRIYKMYHQQDCCEHVYIEDVVGDVEDLIGGPLLIAEEVSNKVLTLLQVLPTITDESGTWTYYRFATRKGSVSIRWYGSSNGCYSESVDFYEMTN